MPVREKSKLERQLTVLLRDYDYKVEGNVIISKGIKGMTEDRVWGRCRDLQDACEQLCPIIRETDFTDRLVRYTSVI